MIKERKKGEYVKFKNYKRKIKLSFMIDDDFEDNGKQNPDESYTVKYKKHVPCSYSNKSVCVGDKFFKPCLDEKTFQQTVCNDLKKMIKISRTLLNVGFWCLYWWGC